jgi:dihydroorotate dehydrogenase electron transfer subunit
LKQVLAKIISNEVLTKRSTEAPQANLLCIETPEIAATARPGQFAMLSCGPNVMLRRPLSIHHVDASGRIYFLFVVIGKGTRWLSQQGKRTSLAIIGPLGNGFSIEPFSKKLLLLAGGIGISPLAFLAQQALNQLYKQNLPLNKMEIITLTDDGSDGIKGKISDFQHLPAYINQADQVFVCGPLPMYQALFELIGQKSLKKRVQASLEVRMGCGFGVCYGCGIKTRQGMKMVCGDGPIFDMDEILWKELNL